MVNEFYFQRVLRLIKINPASENEIHSTEELQLLVKQSADSGEIEEENYEIIKNAFDFTDHNAKQIMVPRQNIFSININDDKKDIVEKCWKVVTPEYLYMMDL